jgi:hypothetical protein
MYDTKAIINYAKRDVLRGFRYTRIQLIPALLFFLLTSLSFFKEAQFALNNNMYIFMPTFADCLVNMFKGMSIYIPDTRNTFSIPFSWLIINVYIAYLVGYYPMRDLSGFGKYILLSSKDRRNWWIGKFTWSALIVIAYYLIAYISIFIVSLFFSEFSISTTESLISLTLQEMILYSIVIPMLTSIALSTFQLTLNLYFKPLICFLIIVVLIVSSAYFYTPFLIGNCSMLLRSASGMDNGIIWSTSLLIELTLVIGCFFVGYTRFKKYDILDKS